jgi:PAS domain S-box-containing protein
MSQKKHSPPKAPTSAKALKLVRNLQARQIELELQNKELRQAHEELDASHSRYFDLYNLAPVGYCTISEQGLILKANLTATTLLGQPQSELLKQPINRYILAQDQDSYLLQCKQLLKTSEQQVCDLQMVKYDGTTFWAHLQSTVQQNAAGESEILCILSDISASKQAGKLLTMEQDLLSTIVDLLPAMVFIKDRDSRFLLANSACADSMGVSSPEELLGKNDADFYPPESASKFRDDELIVLQGTPLLNSEQRREFPDGSMKVLLTSKVPKLDSEGKIVGILGTSFDITDRVRNQQLLTWEKSALELIVSSNSLNEVLDQLMLGLEAYAPGAIFSVLLMDDDGMHLRHGAAPSLPDAYNRAIDGIAIGPTAGSCGAAAFENRQIVATDIASDPLWADYRELALEYGLHACCSNPIHCSEGEILGTFAIYYREPSHPDDAVIELLERAAHVIQLAIERVRASEELRRFSAKLEQRVEKRTADLLLVNASLNDFKAALDEHSLVSITDTAGVITYTNDKFCEISKYSWDELIGQNHRIVNSGYHSKSFFRELWETITSGQVWKGEVRNQTKDGSFYWVNTTIVPFVGADGKPFQFMAIRTDITQRKNAEEDLLLSKTRMDIATEAAKIGVWDWDIKSGKVTWDERMFEVFGQPTTPDGMTTYANWANLVLPEDLAKNETRLQRTIAACGRDQRQFRITRPSDGAIRVIHAAEVVVPGADGKAARMIGINRDITEQKDAEERIINLNDDLESRATELQTINKELESFSYSVSHDLRAPLRAIGGFARMVLEDHSEQLNAEGQRMLGVVHGEARRMGHLIDDLLAFSRLGRQSIVPTKIDMGAMAQEVFNELAARAPERKLQLNLHTLPPANGSDVMIYQVWTNLISNALKFTRKREISEVEIGSQKDQDGVVVYYVNDNGSGFDMEYYEKLFVVFQRLHSQQEFIGTGVGLALVQRIVQRHGGRVWAESEVDQGATFFFTLANKKL